MLSCCPGSVPSPIHGSLPFGQALVNASFSDLGWEESGDALNVLLLWPVNVARDCGVQRRGTLSVGDAWLPMTLHLNDQRGSLSTGVHTENRHPGPLDVRAGPR